MAIVPAQLKLYRAQSVHDLDGNGGRMGAREVAAGLKNAIFPDVTNSERLLGVFRLRKVFWKIADIANTPASEARIWLDTPATAGHAVLIWPGTQRDTQAEASGPAHVYVRGRLAADIEPAQTTFGLTVDEGSVEPLADGDLIRIADATNAEFLRIAGAPGWAGDTATVTVSEGPANGYLAAGSRFASVIEQASVEAFVDDWAESGTGGYDETACPVLVDWIGTAEQTWTVEFTSATAFSVTGDTLGSVGAGTVGADFSPSNPDFSRPYFTLRAAGFSGVWSAGDTIAFSTHPAAVPVWMGLVVFDGAEPQDGAEVWLGISVESA